MEFTRNEYHEIAMTVIYDSLTYDSMNLDYDVKELMSDITDLEYEDIDLFLKEVVVKALNHKEEIISLIEPKLVKWKFSRLNRLTQAILLMTVAHYNYVGDVQKPVAINIAVVLAKKYLLDDEYKFINGVLDNILC